MFYVFIKFVILVPQSTAAANKGVGKSIPVPDDRMIYTNAFSQTTTSSPIMACPREQKTDHYKDYTNDYKNTQV